MSEEYELRAELDGEVRVETVYGDHRNMDPKIVPLMVHPDAKEWEIADADASLSAIPVVMNRAYEDEVWAKGTVTITHVKTGRIVRTMDSKTS